MVTIPKTHGPETTLVDIRELFVDDHVHMALIVAGDGALLTTVERSDLLAADGATRAVDLGTLDDRTVSPSCDLGTVVERLRAQGRRRIAVVDDTGRLMGLLCLKRDSSGLCTDDGVRRRSQALAG